MGLFSKKITILGIDFGTESIKVALLEGSGKKVKVSYLYKQPIDVPKDLEPEEEREYLVKGLTEAVAGVSKKKYQRIVFSVPAQNVIARLITMPTVEINKLDNVIRFEAEQHIPFNMDDVAFRYQLISQNEENMNILLTAIKLERLDEFMDVIIESGLDAEYIDVSSYSLFNLKCFNDGLIDDKGRLLSELKNKKGKKNNIEEAEQEDNSIALIDVGAGTTDISVVNGSVLYFTRSALIAGSHFTEAIQKKLNISFEEAEKVKKSVFEIDLESALAKGPGTGAKKRGLGGLLGGIKKGPVKNNIETKPEVSGISKPGGPAKPTIGLGKPAIKPEIGGGIPKPPMKPGISKPGGPAKPTIGLGKPAIKPEIGGGIPKPPMKPGISKPGGPAKPTIGLGKPSMKPEIGGGIPKPPMKPGIPKPVGPAKPTIGLGKPSMKPEIGGGIPKPPMKPGIPKPVGPAKPTIGLGKPAIKPEIVKPGVSVKPAISLGKPSDGATIEPKKPSAGFLKGALKKPEAPAAPVKRLLTAKPSGTPKPTGAPVKKLLGITKPTPPNSLGAAATEGELAEGSLESTYDKKEIFNCVRPLLDRLVTEFRRSIDFYKQVNENGKIKKIILTGGSSELKGFENFLNKRLELPVEKFKLDKIIDLGLSGNENIHEYSTVIGTALRNIYPTNVLNINLLPEDITLRRRKAKQTKSLIWMSSFLIILVVLLGLNFWVNYTAKQTELDYLKDRKAKVKSIIKKLNDAKKQKSKFQLIINTINKLRDNKAKWLDIWSALATNLNRPDFNTNNLFIDNISFIGKGVMRLKCITENYSNVVRFINILDSDKYFEVDKHEKPQPKEHIIDDKKYVSFTISVKLTHNPEIIAKKEAEKNKKRKDGDK